MILKDCSQCSKPHTYQSKFLGNYFEEHTGSRLGFVDTERKLGSFNYHQVMKT